MAEKKKRKKKKKLPEGYSIEWRNFKDAILTTPEGTLWVRRVEIGKKYKYQYAGSRALFGSLKKLVTHIKEDHGQIP